MRMVEQRPAGFRVERFLSAAWVAIALLVFAHGLLRNHSLETVARKTPWWLHASLLAAMWFILLMAPKSDRAFIYFQF